MNCESKEKVWSTSAVDRIVYVLTNRSGGFNLDLFANDYSFAPWSDPSEEWLKLQKCLMLDKTDTDYYILYALNTLSKYPYITNSIDNYVSSVDITKLPVFTSELDSSVSIVEFGNYNSQFIEHSTTFPVPTKYRFKCLGDNQTTSVEADGQPIGSILVNKTYANGYSTISGNWTTAFPFSGAFRYAGNWIADSVFEISYIPKSINLQAWLYYIENELHIPSILEQADLEIKYTSAKTPRERIALLYLAMVIIWDKNNV